MKTEELKLENKQLTDTVLELSKQMKEMTDFAANFYISSCGFSGVLSKEVNSINPSMDAVRRTSNYLENLNQSAIGAMPTELLERLIEITEKELNVSSSFKD